MNQLQLMSAAKGVFVIQGAVASNSEMIINGTSEIAENKYYITSQGGGVGEGEQSDRSGICVGG